jgi:hypothetical protein
MSDRDEIRKRVDAFRAHQLRLAREREDRIGKVMQEVRLTLAEMRRREVAATRDLLPTVDLVPNAPASDKG